MTFLAPGFLIAAAAAAAAVVALHLLSAREPKVELLPTVRFLPDLPVRATSITLRPTDPWLLLLRVLLILLVGTALARPVFTPPREPVARIVAIDMSRTILDTPGLADSVDAYLPAAAVIVFDSAAAELPVGTIDSVRALIDARNATSRASLSAALVASRRAAARIRDRADSLELIIISPFAMEAYDAATERIRGLWPGRITTVAVDAVAAGVAPDSVRVEWADSAATVWWAERPTPDTIMAMRAGGAVLVHPFARRWRLTEAAHGAARVYARWADGEPAAIERHADGSEACVRSLGFSLPEEGDAILRPEFQRFVEELTAPCGKARNFASLPAHDMTILRGNGSLAATASIERPVQHASPLTPWILLAAAVLALLELVVRRRHRETKDTSVEDAASRDPESKGRAA